MKTNEIRIRGVEKESIYIHYLYVYSREAEGGPSQKSTYPYLPQHFEIFLLNAQQLTVLAGDHGGVARGVVQDGLPEGCAYPQCTQRHSILQCTHMVWGCNTLDNENNSIMMN